MVAAASAFSTSIEQLRQPFKAFTRESWDLVIVGGGPAGLATAIVAAERGLSVLVVERREFPPDKACGEGVLPPGVHALEQLGVTRHLKPSSYRPFAGIRFLQEDGTSAECRLSRSGLGIRRTVLVEAMTRRASELGATLVHSCDVSTIERTANDAVVQTSGGRVTARLVVAADGLHSRIRRASGLDAAPGARRRFALRQHYRVAPWTDMVEVHVNKSAQAFATPVTADSVGVNFLWEDGAVAEPTVDSLLARFPALEERLHDTQTITSVKGAGPMGRGALRRTAERLVLMGDAAGFVDSISGDGLSIAFNSALILGRHLPEVLARGGTRESLTAYESAARRLFRGYWIVTNGLLWLARHPAARSTTIHYLSRHERVFRATMAIAMRLMASAD
jgi:flavin-dependent dehydrogenase